MFAKSRLLIGNIRKTAPYWSGLRCTATTASTSNSMRDYVNFPDPVLREYPGKTRLIIVPEEWFDFLAKKTGYTGGYSLFFSLTTYLLSKEIIVIDHEMKTGIVMFAMAVMFRYWKGDEVYSYIKEHMDQENREADSVREEPMAKFQQNIEHEKREQWRATAQQTIAEVRRENVLCQLETTYRQRLIDAYTAVRNRLQFHSEISSIEQRIEHKNMSEWVIGKVMASITSDQQKQSINQCIADLAAMANKAK